MITLKENILNRSVILCCAILSIIAVLSSFVLAATNNGEVAYFYRKTFNVDNNIIDIFEDLGLKTDLINENSIPSNLSKYKLFFVGDENFRNFNRIPVGDKPTIFANSFNGNDWGLVDNDGVSQLASNSPLNVEKNNQIIQVYTQALYKIGGAAIPYYYLDNENKAANMMSVAKTYTGDGEDSDFGDVISYANASVKLLNGKTTKGRLCFYGIIESNFWTPAAKEMFRDCAEFVGTACEKDLDCPADSESGPFCKNDGVYKTVTSYSCKNPGKIESICERDDDDVLVEQCSDYCSNGECKNFTCRINSDCGTDGFIGNNFCTANNVTRNFQTFTCNNPSTPLSFCSNSISVKVNQTCSDGCQNGECLEIDCFNDLDCNDNNLSTIDSCSNPGTFNSTCVYTPIKCFTNLDCNDKNATTNDTCHNPGTVQSFCTNDPLPIACRTDPDCDDGIRLTIDQCINPGQIDSFCRNTRINCGNNDDCGFTGFFGEEFCSLDNVYKSYQNATCINPGTTNSFCAVNESKLLVNQCTAGCTDGICIECDDDLDCDDDRNDTVDICRNPGTTNSTCINEIIDCFSDDDCGIDGFVGNEYCTENEITKNFQTFTCDNPGNVDSECFSEITQIFEEECEGLCSDGMCIDLTFSCNIVNGNCNATQTQVLRLTGLNNAHAALVNNEYLYFPQSLLDGEYPYALCCNSNAGLNNSCMADSAETVVLLASTINAHVAEEGGDYSLEACLASDAGQVNCEYRSSCLSSEQCLMSISAEDNAHAGECDAYGIDVCCSVQ